MIPEEFVGSLHVIAASDSPIDQQRDAVRQVVDRLLREANEIIGGDQKRVRSWLENVELELARQALQPRGDRFADLRDHARELIANWLRQNPRLDP